MKSQFLDTLKNALSVLLHTDPLLLGALLLGFLADLITGFFLKDGVFVWQWRAHLRRMLYHLLLFFGVLFLLIPFSNANPLFGWMELPAYTTLLGWQAKKVIWNLTTPDMPLRASLTKMFDVIDRYNRPTAINGNG